MSFPHGNRKSSLVLPSHLSIVIGSMIRSPGQTNQDVRSLADVHSSVGTSQVTFWRRMFAFAGPAYLVSVGYMDPGNWATDLEGGPRFNSACTMASARS